MTLVHAAAQNQRDQAILDHLPQVHLIATKIHRRLPHQVDFDDLVSAGTVGLIQAVDRYQPGRGYKLKTLAEHRIRGAILDYLRVLDPLSRSMRRFLKMRAQVIAQLEQERFAPPSESEIADAMGVSIDRYRRDVQTVTAARTIAGDADGG